MTENVAGYRSHDDAAVSPCREVKLEFVVLGVWSALNTSLSSLSVLLELSVHPSGRKDSYS